MKEANILDFFIEAIEESSYIIYLNFEVETLTNRDYDLMLVLVNEVTLQETNIRRVSVRRYLENKSQFIFVSFLHSLKRGKNKLKIKLESSIQSLIIRNIKMAKQKFEVDCAEEDVGSYLRSC